MFCPKCGKGDQSADSYCRSCGDFLIDPAQHTLMNRILGITNPERQVKFTLTIDLVTAVVSGFLLFFLMGYFDAVHDKTGATTPPIVYLVYIFLGLVSAWQLLSFTVGTTYRKKLNAAKKTIDQTAERQSLPEADQTNVANSITEQTTRNLDKVPRR